MTEKEQEVLALLLENANYTMPQLAEKLKISRKINSGAVEVIEGKKL